MFEHLYGEYVFLLLPRKIYSLNQPDMEFWRQLLIEFTSMGYSRKTSDPCLYFSWTVQGLLLWLSWIYDFLVLGNTKGVKFTKNKNDGSLWLRLYCQYEWIFWFQTINWSWGRNTKGHTGSAIAKLQLWILTTRIWGSTNTWWGRKIPSERKPRG